MFCVCARVFSSGLKKNHLRCGSIKHMLLLIICKCFGILNYPHPLCNIKWIRKCVYKSISIIFSSITYTFYLRVLLLRNDMKNNKCLPARV